MIMFNTILENWKPRYAYAFRMPASGRTYGSAPTAGWFISPGTLPGASRWG